MSEKHEKVHMLDGISSIRVINVSSIEITRDRHSLLGLAGPAKEIVKIGAFFNLMDADHIRLRYRLMAIDGNQISLKEFDTSQLAGEEHPRHKIRSVALEVYQPTKEDRDADTVPELILKVGEKKTLTDLDIKLSKIIADNRCPKGQNCYWPGMVAAELEISTGTRSESLIIGNISGNSVVMKQPFDSNRIEYPQGPTLFGDRSIRLVEIEPERTDTQPIRSSLYRLHFQIGTDRKALASEPPEGMAVRIASEYLRRENMDAGEFTIQVLGVEKGKLRGMDRRVGEAMSRVDLYDEARAEIGWKKRKPGLLGGDGHSRELHIDLTQGKVIEVV